MRTQTFSPVTAAGTGWFIFLARARSNVSLACSSGSAISRRVSITSSRWSALWVSMAKRIRGSGGRRYLVRLQVQDGRRHFPLRPFGFLDEPQCQQLGQAVAEVEREVAFDPHRRRVTNRGLAPTRWQFPPWTAGCLLVVVAFRPRPPQRHRSEETGGWIGTRLLLAQPRGLGGIQLRRSRQVALEVDVRRPGGLQREIEVVLMCERRLLRVSLAGPLLSRGL